MDLVVRVFPYLLLLVIGCLVFWGSIVSMKSNKLVDAVNEAVTEHHVGVKGMKWGIVHPVADDAVELDPRSGSTEEFISWLDKELKIYDPPKPVEPKEDPKEEVSQLIVRMKTVISDIQAHNVFAEELIEGMKKRKIMVLPPEVEVTTLSADDFEIEHIYSYTDGTEKIVQLNRPVESDRICAALNAMRHYSSERS